MGPLSGKATEEIRLVRPWKVLHKVSRLLYQWKLKSQSCGIQADFFNLESGAYISNIVSQGKDETDLYLTFYFDWKYPNMKEGSKEEKETSDQLWNMAKKAVQHTIDNARNMAKEGKLSKA